MHSELSNTNRFIGDTSIISRHDPINSQRDIARMWRLDTFDGVEFLQATYFKQTFPMHMHETYVLGVILKGAEQFFYRGSTYTAPEGSIILIPPYEVHSGNPAPGTVWRYKCIYPSITLVQKIIRQIDVHIKEIPVFTSPVIDDKVLASRILALHRSLCCETDMMSLESEMIMIFAELIKRHSKESKLETESAYNPKEILLARDIIMDNLAESVSLKELSSVVGLSQFQIINGFKKTFGLPPHRYQLNMRIMKARMMLTEGKSIAATAYDLGFSDQSHFNRHFKSILGVTPGKYYRQSIN